MSDEHEPGCAAEDCTCPPPLEDPASELFAALFRQAEESVIPAYNAEAAWKRFQIWLDTHMAREDEGDRT